MEKNSLLEHDEWNSCYEYLSSKMKPTSYRWSNIQAKSSSSPSSSSSSSWSSPPSSCKCENCLLQFNGQMHDKSPLDFLFYHFRSDVCYTQCVHTWTCHRFSQLIFLNNLLWRFIVRHEIDTGHCTSVCVSIRHQSVVCHPIWCEYRSIDSTEKSSVKFHF